ncbi:sigma-54-dependent Fis family transcriptional regulator [Rhodococcus jostii]|uniref:Helix-turn-helix domain-containing protein n=1 Tax=Rhodococcus jostii TaxID=132919 RepID=A0ABU4CSU4_RHOJO|nr:helix-turn-helix domain-containing protein [Rhodococcus jostii]MDV6286619.1 helix-turn-helix domain-containing protein [Rhodococcus jostii]
MSDPAKATDVPARVDIAEAWQRASMSGLHPSSRVDGLSYAEVDRRSRLLVAAGPVLDTLAERLDGTRYCVILADREARIVERRFGQRVLAPAMDAISAAPGTQYTEAFTGTNSIATVHETQRGMRIAGDEHFIEALKRFCCYGHPIVNPLTRRLEGVLDITGFAADVNDLLAPFLIMATREIEQRLLLGARAAQQNLLTAFQTVSAQVHCPVLALGEGVSLANPSATTELGPQDHVVLRAMAVSEAVGDRCKHPLTLASGRNAVVEMAPVHGGGDGVIVRVSVDERRPRSTRTPVASTSPEPRAHAPTVLVVGEPGTGRSTWSRGRLAPDDAVVIDACDDLGWTEWARRIRNPGGPPLILENLDLLPSCNLSRLRHTLKRSLTARITATAAICGSPNSEYAALVSMFDDVVELAPLRNRPSDLPAIAAAMLAELDPTKERSLSPGLLDVLVSQPWPGNLHELKSVLRQMLVGTDFPNLTIQDLPASLRGPSHRPQRTPLAEAEYQAILGALNECGGNKVKTARKLGISRATLYSKLRVFRIIA